MIPRYTLRQRLLGVFVVVQLVFLTSFNLVQTIPIPREQSDELSDGRGGLPPGQANLFQKAAGKVYAVDAKWAYLTGQLQAWWLFAPTFPHQATFPRVRLNFAEGPLTLESSLEPPEAERYFRFSPSGDRFFHYEVRLGLIYSEYSAAWFAKRPEEWRDAVFERVRRQWKSIRAYLRWRWLAYQNEHPDAPVPDSIDLLIRIDATPLPGKPRRWERPLVLPLARWNPSEPDSGGKLPVEAYDLVARRFVSLEAMP